MINTPITSETLPQGLHANPILSRWVSFLPDEKVRIFSGKVELGQGIGTALIQIAADGLGLDPSRIELVSGDTAYGPNEGVTAGSLSIEHGGVALRAACEEVRSLAAQQAAKILGCRTEDLRLRDGRFLGIHDLSSLSKDVSYWMLADQLDLQAAAQGLRVGLAEVPAPVSGRAWARVDLPEKLSTGGFIHDVSFPGMLHARVLRIPHPKIEPVFIDEVAICSLPGVRNFMRKGAFMAVVSEREDQAVWALQKALGLLRWPDPVGDDRNLNAADLLVNSPRQTSQLGDAEFDTQSGESDPNAASWMRLHCTRPFLAHASIGPSCAIARPIEQGLEIWSHSQSPFSLRDQIARVLQLSSSQVIVKHAPGAGCYGHNGADDVALDAALIAMEVQQPVRVLWTREQDLTCAPFGSAMATTVAARVDHAGKILGWKSEIWSHSHAMRPGMGPGVNLRAAWDLQQGIEPSPPQDFPRPAGGGDRNAQPIYDFPACDIRYHFVEQSSLRTSAIRSLGAYLNTFAIESLIDDIANRYKLDPVALRINHLSDPRGQELLRFLAQWARWDSEDRPNYANGEHGWGVGFGRYKNSAAWCGVLVKARMAEVVRIEEVFVVVDAGLVINPDGVHNQVEGGVIQALSWTLKEQVLFSAQGPKISGWDDYPILKFSEAPEVHVKLIDHASGPSLGVGECAAGPTAAAVGNAIAWALGVRATQLPLTIDTISEAILK